MTLARSLLLWLGFSGCMGATAQQLRMRAAFDLACPQDQIQVVEIDERTRGAQGCGRRAAYVETCNTCANGYQGGDCTWILNAEPSRTAAASNEPPSVASEGGR